MVDVVVAGGGPNGLMVACELALAGVRPIVVEKRVGPSTEQRANGMVGQVIRLLDRRGLYERMSGDAKPPEPAPGFMFAAFPLQAYDIPDNPLYLLMVPQRKIEQVLKERALELGVEIREGHEVTGLTQKDDVVEIEVNGDYRIDARYIVGADGGRSAVRKMAGIEFPGVTRDDSVSRAAHVTVPEEWVDKKTGGLDVPGFGVIPPFMHTRTERGLVTYAPFPDGRVLVSAGTRERPETDEPFSISEMQEVFSYVVGAEVPLGQPDGPGPHTLRRLTGGNTRIAERYRDHRVLLVGDAAHVHSAIGGPGLNLGLQDAVNLGWKLAATVQGWAPEGLLDTYEKERRPAGERVTMQTQAQSVLVGPGPEVTALRTLFGELLEEPTVRRRLVELVAGADVRYDFGPDPLVGRFAPDLGPVQRGGRPVLLDGTGTLGPVLEPWRDRVDLVPQPAGKPSLLVRPDSYVAWASTDQKPDQDTLRAALRRWFGEV